MYCFSRNSERVRANSSLKSIGLLRKSSAPALIPLMRSAVAESPVIRTTGVRRVSGVALMRRQTSNPSDAGHHDIEKNQVGAEIGALGERPGATLVSRTS